MRTAYKIFFLALGISAITAYAGDMGRLFFTPEQRAQLDYDHAREFSPDNSNNGVILSGIVQKHGGKRTAWINGVSQPAGESDERSPESMPVVIPGKSKSIKIKVGQKVEVSPAGLGQ